MPTPNNMPQSKAGAADTDGADDQDDDQQQQDDGQQDGAQSESGSDDIDLDALPEPVRKELEKLRSLHKDERKWERIAKRNRDDAEAFRKNKERIAKLDETEAASRTEAENYRIQLETERQARIQAETREKRREIAAEMGVPVRAVVGDTEEDMRESASEYSDVIASGIEAQLKQRNIGPAAPASAVTSNGKPTGAKQLHQSDIEGMDRKKLLEAYRNGQLDEAIGKAK